mgnify:CR=1 FL=1
MRARPDTPAVKLAENAGLEGSVQIVQNRQQAFREGTERVLAFQLALALHAFLVVLEFGTGTQGQLAKLVALGGLLAQGVEFLEQFGNGQLDSPNLVLDPREALVPFVYRKHHGALLRQQRIDPLIIASAGGAGRALAEWIADEVITTDEPCFYAYAMTHTTPAGATRRTLGVFGAYVVGVKLIGIDVGAFWGNMQAAISFWPDITNGIIKSVVFGVAVSLIAVFEGYDAKPTAEGVSTATTRTVVMSSLAILALDFVMTVFMFRAGNV